MTESTCCTRGLVLRGFRLSPESRKGCRYPYRVRMMLPLREVGNSFSSFIIPARNSGMTHVRMEMAVKVKEV